MPRMTRSVLRGLAPMCAAGLLLQSVACERGPADGQANAARGDTARRAPAPAATPAGTATATGAPTTGATPAPGAGIRVSVARSDQHGAYLVGGSGRALYLLEEDGTGQSTCVEMCAVVWPPLLAGAAAPAAGDSAVQSRLLGSVARPGGGNQVTYGGRPLYFYIGDAKPGDVRGQHVEDSWGEWYLVSPAGRSIEGERAGARGDDRRRGRSRDDR